MLVTRLIFRLAQIGRVISYFFQRKNNTFDYENLTTKKNIWYKGVTLGKEFEGEGLDSEQHKVVFVRQNYCSIQRTGTLVHSFVT